MTHPLPVPDDAFGNRVRARLREERVIWLTTVAADGTPQPNPVWFYWDGGDTLLIYNRPGAHRLAHLRARPRLAMHFDGNGKGGDVVVITGAASVDDDVPPPHEHPEYAAKYRDSMIRVSGRVEDFSRQYPVPLRVTIAKVRGF